MVSDAPDANALVSVGARLRARAADPQLNEVPCDAGFRESEELTSQHELASDWGPTPGASARETTFELCANGHDPDAQRRRARLRRYLGSAVTLVETRCESDQSESKVDKTSTLTSERDLARIDKLLRDGHSIMECSSGSTCTWSAPGATAVTLTWQGTQLVELGWGPGTLMPCIPD